MNIHKKIRNLQVGDDCYVLNEDLTVEVIKVVEVLESMYTPDCMKIKFDKCIPDIHVEGSVNMVSLGSHLGSLYLEKDLILNELEYRQNVIVQQIDKLKGDCSTCSYCYCGNTSMYCSHPKMATKITAARKHGCKYWK